MIEMVYFEKEATTVSASSTYRHDVNKQQEE